MALEEDVLASKYELVNLSVHSSTQISSRAAAVVTKLSAAQSSDAKPVIVTMRTGARTASKLISIAEIAKRDLTSKGVKMCQYTALSSEMIEVERKPKRKAVAVGEQENEGGESDDAFETMGAASETGTKKRSVPVLTVYLSAKPIKELRNEYG